MSFLSYRRCKGTAVLGDREIFGGLLSEVVATGAGICDKGLTRRQNRVANIRNERQGFTYNQYLYNLKCCIWNMPTGMRT